MFTNNNTTTGSMENENINNNALNEDEVAVNQLMIQEKRKITDQERQLIIRKFEDNKGPKQISQELEIKCKTVTSIINVYKNTGRIDKLKSRRGPIKRLNNEYTNFIKEKIDNDCSITLKTLKENLFTEKNIVVSLTTINNAITDFNYSFKRCQLIPVARNTDSAIEHRYNYCCQYLSFNDENVIFLDEFGISTSTRNKYGRSKMNTTPKKVVRTIRSKNQSVLAAVSKNRVINYRTRNGSFNRESFTSFLDNLITILINDGYSKTMIIMDNCSIHKEEEVKNIIESRNFHLLYTPPYSPQLNPIEEVFSKWKNIIKRKNPNTCEELLASISNGMDEITTGDCIGFFNHVREWAVKGVRKENF